MSQPNDLPLGSLASQDGRRIALVEAQWHADIVHQARDAFLAEMERLGVPASLGELGLPPEGPAEVARIACASPYYNPRPFEPVAIQALLERARDGLPPA